MRPLAAAQPRRAVPRRPTPRVTIGSHVSKRSTSCCPRSPASSTSAKSSRASSTSLVACIPHDAVGLPLLTEDRQHVVPYAVAGPLADQPIPARVPGSAAVQAADRLRLGLPHRRGHPALARARRHAAAERGYRGAPPRAHPAPRRADRRVEFPLVHRRGASYPATP